MLHFFFHFSSLNFIELNHNFYFFYQFNGNLIDQILLCMDGSSKNKIYTFNMIF